MNAHEILERFLTKSPRQKLITALVFIGVLAIVACGLVYVGHRISRAYSDYKYAKETAVREKQIEDLKASEEQHEKNEAQLAAQNGILKKQNESLAEVYAAADTKAKKQAADDFAARTADKAKRLDEIDADANYDSQVCGLCADAKRSGFPLSKEFCKRCEEVK